MIHDSNNFLLTCATNQGHCDDDFVARIDFNGGLFRGANQNYVNVLGMEKNSVGKYKPLFTRCSVNYNSNNGYGGNKIVVILESPSNTEFKNRLNRIGPAMGKTGDRINTQFIPLLNRAPTNIKNSIPFGKYDVYLVNAIRYQCDLGVPQQRSVICTVFHNLWMRQPDSFEQDLYDRLTFLAPTMIINACTNDLKIYCNKQKLQSNFNNSAVCEATNHPLRWNRNTKLR